MTWPYTFPNAAPLKMTANLRADLKEAFACTRRLKGGKGDPRSPDADLPRDFVTQLICALNPDPKGDPWGMLQRVESGAARATLLNSTKTEARATLKRYTRQRAILFEARDIVARFWPHGGPGAAALSGIDATIERFDDLIGMYERVLASNQQKGGPAIDWWRRALIVELYRWWRERKWHPTTKDHDYYGRTGVFAAIVLALLNARNTQLKLAKPEQGTISLRAELKALSRLTHRQLVMLDIAKWAPS